jgi:DNA-directed RNA polymerase specialized sigma24 family protein
MAHPTATEFAAAYHAALVAAEKTFSSPSRRAHLDHARDGATDAVLRAARQYDPSRGTFARQAASYVARELSKLCGRFAERDRDRPAFAILRDEDAATTHEPSEWPTEAVARLTAVERLVVTLKYKHGYSYREIGQIRWTSHNAAFKAIKRAMGRMRTLKVGA